MTCAPGERAIRFDDGDAYERFMGRWSRAAGVLFLDWLAPHPQARWLEVGCGTGAFTQLIHERCRPAAIVAVDPARAQLAYARRRLARGAAAFRVAAAEALRSSDASHDIVVSALAFNFMADRPAALREMRRVSRAGGTIAGYVWDFAAGRTPHAPLVRALHRVGIDAPSPPGGDDCDRAALHILFAGAGLVDVETTALDIEVIFADLAAFWTEQTPSFSPTTQLIAQLGEDQRNRLMEAVCGELTPRPDGRIVYPARANAVKARVP